MSPERLFRDGEGNVCSLDDLVRREPGWAANRIRELERGLEIGLRELVAPVRIVVDDHDRPGGLVHRAMYEQVVAQRDAAHARLRLTAQILVAEIGSNGPEDADECARRAVQVIASLRAEKNQAERLYRSGMGLVPCEQCGELTGMAYRYVNWEGVSCGGSACSQICLDRLMKGKRR